jgi:hypothetical protein
MANIAPQSVRSEEKHFLESIGQAPLGLALGDLLRLHPKVARRTAQRWISAAIAKEAIQVVGKGRATRYFLRPTPTAVLEVSINTQAFPLYIPISKGSLDVLAYVDRSLAARKPVGFQRDFLESYEPNISSYLSPQQKRQLYEMGTTTQAVQPAGTYSRFILNRLLIDLSWASSNLEGNTYSRLDTIELIENGRSATGKGAFETQMILNHKAAIELLVENLDALSFNRYTVMNLHSALSENLLPNPADEGRVRLHAVDIGKSVYRPLANPLRIDETLTLLLQKLNQISDPFEQSFFAMVHIPYLQPFADINKRTSRLLANLPLFRANLCPLTFLDVPTGAYSRAILGIYEMTSVELLRDVYLWAYERSTQEYLAIKQELADPDPIRLQYRDIIKSAVRAVVQTPNAETQGLIAVAITAVPPQDKAAVSSAILQALKTLHEGVLARYGLKPAEFFTWSNSQR